jgi:lipopolysaccharide transport system permease protein
MKPSSEERGATPARVVREYVPDSRYSASPVHATRALFQEILQFRSHILTLFSNDFRAAYRGTALGVFWNIVLPLVPISVYLLLVNIRVFPSHDAMDPALFLAFNIMVWYFITGLISRPMDVVKAKASTAMKTSLPLSVAIASSFAQLSFDTLVRLCLVVVLVFVFRTWPAANPIGVVISIFSAVVFCMSLGLILSIVNMVYSDAQRLVTMFLQYGLFLSGVIFPVSAMGSLSFLATFNPLCVFVTSLREYLFVGHYEYETALWIWSGVSLVMYLLAVRFFYTMEQRVRGLT